MLTPARLRPALLCEVVKFQDSPEEKGPSYIELMRQCCYVNSEAPDLGTSKFIPEVSGIQLLLYGLNERGNNVIATYLHKMLAIEVNFTWHSFEYYHANFELIRYNLLDKTSQTLLTLYPNAVFNSELWKPETITISMFKRLAKIDHQYDFDSKADQTIARQHVVIPAKGNPAFDIGIQTDNVMLAIEIRWSDEGSSKINFLADITAKRDLLPGSPFIFLFDLSRSLLVSSLLFSSLLLKFRICDLDRACLSRIGTRS